MAPAESPVRLYAEEDYRLPRRLSAFLRERIEDLSAIVLQGQLSRDDYKEYTGRITGMKTALEECERIEKDTQ